MSAYDSLAPWYDGFTGDVPYEAFADFYERCLHREGQGRLTLLALCCGTGTVSLLLAQRGQELIGVDRSPEMLSVSAEKAAETEGITKPLFLCQEAAELDLYGTVSGAYCCLDGVNYLPPEDLPELFRRLHLFIEPGGRFAFDFHAPAHLRALDGETFADETEDALCLWRAAFDEAENALFYNMDIFSREGRLWRRREEEHVEYAHTAEALCALLTEAGFRDARLLEGGPLAKQGRLFLCAENLPH